jgi:hypothetical protein
MTIILGLTGSIGMGKSTVARMFEAEGVPVFDADAAVHRLQGPEGELVAEIEARFPGTTGAQGVNRSALAERVLGAPEALRNLEALIHPPWRGSGRSSWPGMPPHPWWCSTSPCYSKRAAPVRSTKWRSCRRRFRSRRIGCWRGRA